VHIPVSVGEVVDKITILDIKLDKMTDPTRLANVARERAALQAAWEDSGLAWPAPEADALARVNRSLWQTEDDLRRLEAAQDFGAEFVVLARAVYVTNDERARIKRRINEALGSDLVEEKSYVDYARPGAGG
jgi:hypothetical protein